MAADLGSGRASKEGVMTKIVKMPWGETEVQCEPGERENPVDCTRHSNHYWCSTCLGYYGVPHDGGMHEGPSAHPNQFWNFRTCACRMCKNRVAELEAK